MIKLALLAVLVVPLTSGEGCKRVATNFAACEIGKLSKDALGILPDVKTALAGETIDWQAALTNIGLTAGVDTVNCAVYAILAELGGVHGRRTPEGRRTLARGRQWLGARGIKPPV